MGRSSYDPDAGHENVFARIVASDAELPIDLRERLVREGQRINVTATGSANVAAGAVNTAIATASSAIPLIGKAVWIERVDVFMSSLVRGQVLFNTDAAGRFGQYLDAFLGRSASFQVNQLFRAYELSNGVITMAVRQLFDDTGLVSAGARDVHGAISLAGYAITDDLNFSAEKTILAIGDSILNGTGPTVSANMWTFKARDKFREQGKTVRIVQMANSSSTTSDHETWRKAGRYDGVEADVIFYALGVNDAGAAVSAATYRANLAAFWSHCQKRWPNAKLIVCGVSPVEHNTTHAAAESLRDAAAAFVSDTNHDNLFYINLGTAFLRTDSSYYVSTDAAGSRVHPDDDGHAAIATLVNAEIDAQGIRI